MDVVWTEYIWKLNKAFVFSKTKHDHTDIYILLLHLFFKTTI